MEKLLNSLGMFVGGWIGWAIGAPGGMFLAFCVSIVGTGLGLWIAHRATSQYF